jgi:hypothetical protein
LSAREHHEYAKSTSDLAFLVEWEGGYDVLETFLHPLAGMMTFALALPIIFWLGGDSGSPAASREVNA